MGPSPAQPPTSFPDRIRKPDLGRSSPPVSASASRHQALRGRGWDGRPVRTNSRDPRPQQELGCFWGEKWGALCGDCPCVACTKGSHADLPGRTQWGRAWPQPTGTPQGFTPSHGHS